MMKEMETNLNLAECIKETTTIGGRIITNVCTGSETALPIGLDTYVILSTFAALTILVLVFCCVLIRDMIRGY